MFDMDGTLTDSCAIDENCYVLAIQQALNLSDVRTDWDGYAHTTSSFCLEEIVRHARGRPPAPEESHAVQTRMVELMAEIEQRKGRRTREVPGAAACVRALPAAGYAVAIASGDWEATARHKLAAAGIPFASLPSTFCEASHVRVEIMVAALARAAAHHRCTRFERIVYVGDGPWDVRACRELGWPFVGVGQGEQARRLCSLGATQVIPHYLEFGDFLSTLGQAASPRPAAA